MWPWNIYTFLYILKVNWIYNYLYPISKTRSGRAPSRSPPPLTAITAVDSRVSGWAGYKCGNRNTGHVSRDSLAFKWTSSLSTKFLSTQFVPLVTVSSSSVFKYFCDFGNCREAVSAARSCVTTNGSLSATKSFDWLRTSARVDNWDSW